MRYLDQTSDDPDNRIQEFLASIGLLVIAWSHLENGLNGFARIIYQRFNYGQPIPNSVKRKLTYLKAAATKVPELQPFRRDILNLTQAVKAHSDDRHTIIHGISDQPLQGVYEGTGTIRFRRMLLENAYYNAGVSSYAANDITGHARKALQLTIECVDLEEKLLDSLSPNDFD